MLAKSYLSRLRGDSVGADFQSVRKLTNDVYLSHGMDRS